MSDGITVVNVHGVVRGKLGIHLGDKKAEEDFADAPDIESLVEKSENDAIGLKPLEDFGEDKDALEAYGKELGIDLSKRKTVSNMYADLVEFVNK